MKKPVTDNYEEITPENKVEYYHITYPSILDHIWILDLWKKYMCPNGCHLLDEVWSIESHSLFCDACEIDIPITGVYKWNPDTKRNEKIQ
jgi:hypothetical protein